MNQGFSLLSIASSSPAGLSVLPLVWKCLHAAPSACTESTDTLLMEKDQKCWENRQWVTESEAGTAQLQGFTVSMSSAGCTASCFTHSLETPPVLNFFRMGQDPSPIRRGVSLCSSGIFR